MTTAKTLLGRGFAASALLLLSATVSAQAPQGEVKKTPKAYTPPPIFGSSEVMQFTLLAPFKQLKKERSGTPPYHAAEIKYTTDSGEVRVPVRVRTRGIWRRKNCDIPPLRLNFSKDSVKKTAFRHVDNVRLVIHCRDNDEYEQWVLQEYQLYRVQRLVTPLSMDARLVRVVYVDPERNDTLATRYAFLLESEAAFGERMGGKVMDIKGASPADLDGPESALFGVWQYFIGNVDFSIGALHNAALLQKDTAYYPIAYDFDWSGAVNTRYSGPPPQLPIKRVTERIMRGYCTSPENYEKAFAVFREKKEAIYALYRDPLAARMKPGVVNNTLRFFDQFYETINDPRAAKRQIVQACLGGQA
jgi:hypothetical protein